MKLYHLEGCPYCRLVRDKLDELGLSYEVIEVPPEHHRRTEVIKVSGQPLVPVLVDGDLVLDDEEKILAYLAQRYGRGLPRGEGPDTPWDEEPVCLDGG